MDLCVSLLPAITRVYDANHARAGHRSVGIAVEAHEEVVDAHIGKEDEGEGAD
jgi:hypothetical protein